MAWTYEARMERAIARFVDEDIFDINASEMYKRAKFFGKYAFRIALSPDLSNWYRFNELKDELHAGLDPLDAHILSVKPTYDFYVYGNDPAILRWVYDHRAPFFVHGVRQTDPAFWSKRLPKQHNDKGQFYGEYRFRIKMRLSDWGTVPENNDQLDELGIDHKLVLKSYSNTKNLPFPMIRNTFVYVKKLNEVLVLKLMFADQVAEVEERV